MLRMALVYITIVIIYLHGSHGKCPDNTEVYTGDGRVQWTARVNGVEKAEVLAPNKEFVFIASDVSNINIEISLNPKDIQLEEISLETTKASTISAHGESGKGNANGPDSPRWIQSQFFYNKLTVEKIKIKVVSPTGEVGIRSVFIKGCVPVGWCPWKRWSDCNAKCGEARQSRSRICRCPNPDPSLFQCEGSNKETRSCNLPCCKEQIDFTNNEDIKIKVTGNPDSKGIKGTDLLLKSGAPLEDTVLLDNIEGTDKVIIKFKGETRDVIEIGVETLASGEVFLKAKPGIWKASDKVPINEQFEKSIIKAPGGQLNNQKQITLEFAYPTGEIGVRGIYIIVCKK